MPLTEPSTVFQIATIVFQMGAIASILLTIRGLASKSWSLMWVAALASLVVSIATALSIGAFVLLATCLQLGVAVALRRNVTAQGWVAALLVGFIVWSVVVPAQMLVADRLPPEATIVLLVVIVLWVASPLLPTGRPGAKAA